MEGWQGKKQQKSRGEEQGNESKNDFGTAGVPGSSKDRSSVAGIARVRELGLDAMELEFVRGVNMGKETAKQVKKAKETI